MSYILTIVLFNGIVSYQEFDTAHECNMALYKSLDEIFIKNIDIIECNEND